MKGAGGVAVAHWGRYYPGISREFLPSEKYGYQIGMQLRST